MNDAVAVHLRITGRVQGVGYRFWTVEQATARNLAGWVRNRRDGSVEALIAGPPATVRAMVEACRQGPMGARVTDIQEAQTEPPAEPGFRQLPTA